jgi:hypothetical protein
MSRNGASEGDTAIVSQGEAATLAQPESAILQDPFELTSGPLPLQRFPQTRKNSRVTEQQWRSISVGSKRAHRPGSQGTVSVP